MSEKVKLPKEVADAIERFRRIDCTNADIIYMFASGQDKANISFSDYASDNFDTLLQALVNGYEVELTPEEKVKEQYDKWDYIVDIRTHDYSAYGFRIEGMKTTLDLLGIKIKGVNADE